MSFVCMYCVYFIGLQIASVIVENIKSLEGVNYAIFIMAEGGLKGQTTPDKSLFLLNP